MLDSDRYFISHTARLLQIQILQVRLMNPGDGLVGVEISDLLSSFAGILLVIVLECQSAALQNSMSASKKTSHRTNLEYKCRQTKCQNRIKDH